MNKRKGEIINKRLALALLLSILVLPFSSNFLNVSSIANTNEDYVVITNDNLNNNKLTETLDLSEIDIYNNNVISTAKLSESQAKLLKANKDVVVLEKDIVLKGSSIIENIEKPNVDSDDIEGPVLDLTEDYLDPQTLAQYEAITDGLPVKDEILWNLEMIGVSGETATLPVKEKVKVAILDSV